MPLFRGLLFVSKFVATLLLQPAPSRTASPCTVRFCEHDSLAAAIPAGAAHDPASLAGAASCNPGVLIRPSEDFCLQKCIFIRRL